jgi:hypothetical protein
MCGMMHRRIYYENFYCGLEPGSVSCATEDSAALGETNRER